MVLRVENEHCANVAKSRAYGELMLPFTSFRVGKVVNADTGRSISPASVVADSKQQEVNDMLQMLHSGDRSMTGLDRSETKRPVDVKLQRKKTILQRVGSAIARAHTQDFVHIPMQARMGTIDDDYDSGDEERARI